MGESRLGLLQLTPPGELRILFNFSGFCCGLFSGEELRRLPMESDSVADEPVSSTLKLALSAISAKKREGGFLINAEHVVVVSDGQINAK